MSSEPLREGDKVRINSGPFEGKVGIITRLDGERATVVVDVFAKETPLQVRLTDLVIPPAPG